MKISASLVTPAFVTQRYQCKICKNTFTETLGTVFHRRHHDLDTIVECLAMLADRNTLAAIHRIKEETVSNWLHDAASHVELIESV